MTVRRAAVLGSPISHSLSPALHRAAYRALDLDWSYDPIEVDLESLPDFMAKLDDSWAGLSLTMPLKSAVIPLLDEVDELARALHSVNTVLPTEQGWRGTNTDVFGIVQALALHQPQTGSALVLGSGATARSALAGLARLGVRTVTVASRRPAPDLADLAAWLGMEVTGAGFEPDPALLARDIVVSTLPGDAGAPWAAACRDAGGTVRIDGTLLDAAYHPWPTPLAAAWPSSRVASGRDMLLWQAVEQVRLMTGHDAPVEAMAAALADAEDARRG